MVKAVAVAIATVGAMLLAPGFAGAASGPTAAATARPNPAAVGSAVHLDETVRGGTSPYAYHWSLVSAPAGSKAKLTSASSATPTFTPDVAGTYQLSVIVTDSQGLSSAPAAVDVQAYATPAPTVAAAARPNPAKLGSLVHLEATSRGGASTYTYQWSLVSAPAGSKAKLSSASSSAPTFTPDVAGTYQLSVTVTDSRGLSSSPAAIDVQTPVPGGPTVAAAARPNPADVDSLVHLDATTGGRAPAYTYKWSLVSTPAGSKAKLTSASTAAPTFTPDVAGTYQLSVTVTDSRGLSSPPAVIDVQAFSPPEPTAAATARPNPAAVGSAVHLDETVRGGTSPYAYQWSLVSAPAGSKAKLTSASSAAPTFTPDVAGTYQLAVIVTDSRGLSSSPAIVSLQAF